MAALLALLATAKGNVSQQKKAEQIAFKAKLESRHGFPRERPKLDYRHPEICKHYLLGFCPNDLHIKHRSEPGSCSRRHSDTAKAAFEKDVASFQARYEKFRWTAAQLSECRAIVIDEDRKIRLNARRLKDTYNAQGVLSGLMIQNFDTLKKLGMVSKNAKIRVLSEIDGEEITDEPNQVEETEHENKASSGDPERNGASDNSMKPPTDAGENASRAIVAEKRLAQSPQYRKQSNVDPETLSTSDSDSDDDADDDFGLIKVIPANKSEQQVKESQKNEQPRLGASTGKDAEKNTALSAVKMSSEFSHRGEASRSCVGLGQAVPPTQVAPLKSINGPGAASESKSPAETTPIQIEEGSVKASTREEDNIGNRSASMQKADEKFVEQGATSANINKDTFPRSGNDTSKKPGPSMDEFYERGVGPDGLLMLDRKQSLRVCACCGGYISLVDAESRLLSHYGGKSHHSLALLRGKVVELETQVSAEPAPTRESFRDQLRPRNVEHERRSSLGDERRSPRDNYRRPPEMHSDRYGERHRGWQSDRRDGRSRRESRGFGTAQWYENVSHENHGHSSRREDSQHRYSSPQHGRYPRGQKRYRSRSPYRDSRRRRHY